VIENVNFYLLERGKNSTTLNELSVNFEENQQDLHGKFLVSNAMEILM
jgi:hypothetical protein